MTYSHLTTAELTTIVNFFTQGTKAYKVAQMLKRSVETIYRVYRYLKTGATIVDYQQQYISNKKRCGRKLAQLPQDEVVYINEMVAQGWTPDTIIGRGDRSISCNRRTLYRMFKRGQFGHLEGDTVQGKHHQGAVMTLVEHLSKVEIVLNVHAKKTENINRHLSEWLSKFPRHFFKSITFDNGKEFAGWREIANQFDIHTYFAEVGAPNQRGLNENNNGLLRRDGLTKDRDLRNLPDELVNQLMSKRNRIPRKSLDYRTPYEVFMEHITEDQRQLFF